MVRELPVGDPVGGHQVEAEALEQGADHRPRHPVAAVDHHAQGLDPVRVDEPQRPAVKVVVDVDRLDRSPARRLREPGLDGVAHVADPRVAGEGQRALADELDAGVGLRVVRGGDHGAAVELARADQLVEHLGGDHAGVEDGAALRDQAVAHPAGHLRRLDPHVATQPDPQLAGLLAAQASEHPGEGAADEPGGVAVHLLAVQPADVVGLEDPGWDGDHQCPPAPPLRVRAGGVAAGTVKTRPSAPRSSARAIAASPACRRAPACSWCRPPTGGPRAGGCVPRIRRPPPAPG